MTAPKRRAAAKRPAPRTVTVELAGDYAGWTATARADFPAKLVVGLESGKLAGILASLEAIVVEHNMPDSTGAIAEHLEDVDPYDGLLKMSDAIAEALQRLPPR